MSERIRANVLGLESTERLDLVQLHWWDVQVRMRNERTRVCACALYQQGGGARGARAHMAMMVC